MITATNNPLQRLADIAHTQVGVHETGTSNTGPEVVQYQRATDLDGTGWPWCAAFVCWCVAQLVKQCPGLLACEGRLPQSASVSGLIDWAAASGQFVFDGSPVYVEPAGPTARTPQAGDIVCMRFATGSHCGIATGGTTEITPGYGLYVPTIEGNTNGPYKASQDPRNGGEVAEKKRSLSRVTHFIRLTLKNQ